jgi:hypothetical protein
MGKPHLRSTVSLCDPYQPELHMLKAQDFVAELARAAKSQQKIRSLADTAYRDKILSINLIN